MGTIKEKASYGSFSIVSKKAVLREGTPIISSWFCQGNMGKLQDGSNKGEGAIFQEGKDRGQDIRKLGIPRREG